MCRANGHIEKYATPYGTVYYTLTGGMMHAPGYDLFLIDDAGQECSFTDIVPSEKVYRHVPEIQNIRFYPEKTHFAFEVTFFPKITQLYLMKGYIRGRAFRHHLKCRKRACIRAQ